MPPPPEGAPDVECFFSNLGWLGPVFVGVGFNLSNGVTDTLESSLILIYLETRESIYTPWSG